MTASTRDRAGPRLASPDRWLLVAAVAAVVPIVVAVVDALADGWVAVGDNGLFLLRSRDVLTAHTPLLGTWTSASLELESDVNNPGPMLFFLFAVPVKLAESGGLAVAAALLNVGSILGIAYVLRRNAGPLAAVLGLAAASALGWWMGRSLLFDPWQPHSLLFPFLLYLALAWVVGAGDRWALPFAAGVGSLLVQSHLSYAYVVPAVGVVAVVGLVGSARGLGGEQRRQELAAHARAGIVTGVVLVACWTPPLLEQLFGEGRGNLGRLLDASRAGAPTVGFERGIRLAAEVLTIWPTWLRSPAANDVADDPMGSAAALAGLAVVAGMLVAAGAWAWRRRDRFALNGVVVAGVATVAGVYTAVGLIRTPLGVAAHHLRYLWPIALVVQLALVVVVVRSLPADVSRRLLPAATIAVVLLSLASLPATEHSVRTNPGPVGSAVRAMNAQLAELEDRGTVLVTFEAQPYGEPFSGPLLAELGRRGVDFVRDAPGGVRQLGPRRAHDGDADAKVIVRWGSAALDGPQGTRRVALASVLTDDETDTWLRLRARLERAIDRGDVALTAAGAAAARRGELGPPTEDGERDPVPLGLLAPSTLFTEALDEGWVRVRGVSSGDLERWVELTPELASGTVAVWLVDDDGR